MCVSPALFPIGERDFTKHGRVVIIPFRERNNNRCTLPTKVCDPLGILAFGNVKRIVKTAPSKGWRNVVSDFDHKRIVGNGPGEHKGGISQVFSAVSIYKHLQASVNMP